MTTDNVFDAAGYDAEGYSRRGYGRDGYNREGYDARGFNREGYDRDGYDYEGFDRMARDRLGYDREGFNAAGQDRYGFGRDHLHQVTRSEFDLNGRTFDGGRYNAAGYDAAGFNRRGYNAEGFDDCGYNQMGLDRCGQSRCDNGDCDEDCSCRRDPGDLMSYDADVLEFSDWRAMMSSTYREGEELLGIELECVARHCRHDAIHAITSRYNAAYSAMTNGRMTYGCICKRDGSLPDEGLEFVSVPMLLREHIDVMRKAFPEQTFGNGMVYGWNVPDYDVGIHISLDARSCSRLLIGKISAFMMEPCNVPFQVAIAGRNCSEYAQFRFDNAILTRRHPSKGRHDDKYQAVHFKHHVNVLEFRLFRSSCKLSTILKNLCYVSAVRQFCMESAARKPHLTSLQFMQWLAKPCNRKSFLPLHQWLMSSTKPDFIPYRTAVAHGGK
jgi:hypothetical protein